jgi:hypothetical protein
MNSYHKIDLYLCSSLSGNISEALLKIVNFIKKYHKKSNDFNSVGINLTQLGT